MPGRGRDTIWIGGSLAAALALGLLAGSALAQNKTVPAPATGADPGTSSPVGNSPVVGAGANGNGGVIQGQPGNGKEKGPPDAATGPKAQEPELSK
ncbi:MAG TPA: hypothetical protein VH414_17290 [Lichenihabitans sp.]|jgi:hypothetical protein|nr:hypothetical protein [Lichenihabitans sp.]